MKTKPYTNIWLEREHKIRSENANPFVVVAETKELKKIFILWKKVNSWNNGNNDDDDDDGNDTLDTYFVYTLS